MQEFILSILGSPEFTALILTAFATAVTSIAGYLALQFRKRILNELSVADLALLRSIAVIAVQYAEQKFKDADGPAKLDAAVEVANTMIAGYGLKVKVQQLVSIIEAAVYAETVHAAVPEPEALSPEIPA
jgi:hypothetical protein